MYHTFRILLLPKGPCWNETSVFFGNKCGNIPLCRKNMSHFTPQELPLQSHLQATCDRLAVNEGVQVVCRPRLAEHGVACFKCVGYTSNPLSLIFCVLYATFAFYIYMCFKKLLYKFHSTKQTNLVGGFNPSETYGSKWIISPGWGGNKKYLKPPPSKWIEVISSISYSAITNLQGFEALLHRLVLKNSGFLGGKKNTPIYKNLSILQHSTKCEHTCWRNSRWNWQLGWICLRNSGIQSSSKYTWLEVKSM